MSPSVVERWLELSTQELRAQVKQLVKARLPGDHAMWQAVRRHPALVARVRGVLSGLSAEAANAKDGHMQKVWISAARTALDQQKPAPKPASKPKTAEPEEEAPRLELPEPPKPAAQRTIPAMVFQEPDK